MKQKILDYLKTQNQGLTLKQIEEALGIETSSDFIVFSKTMEQLEEEAQILRKKDNTYITPDKNGYLVTTISIHGRGYGIFRINEEEFHVEASKLNGAMDGDTVVVHKNPKSGAFEVVGIQAHAHEMFVGTFVSKNGKLKCVLEDTKVAKLNYSIRIPKTFHPSEGLRILLKVVEYGNVVKLEYVREIGHKDDPNVDILSVLLPHGIDPVFPEEVLYEANLLPQEVLVEEMEGRKDERNISFITIDGADSKDFDDAVYIEKDGKGWSLSVAIADVSHYVEAQSQLDKEAYRRGTSTYAVQSVVPMLPHVLSNGICSLNPEVDRLTITCKMRIREDGKVKAYEVYPSVIHSHARMTYGDVNKIYDGDVKLRKQYDSLVDMLEMMKTCAFAIRAARKQKGAIDFDTEESEVIVNERGYPIEIKKRERGVGERVIEDFMIATNVTIAHLMHEKNLPCVYRVHGEPDIKKLRSFKEVSGLLGSPLLIKGSSITPKQLQLYLEENQNHETYPILANLLLRSMQKATYESECIGHYGIAEEEYLHFTSPIRRYPDLIVHRMLRKYYFDKHPQDREYVLDMQLMKDLALQSSVRERESMVAEREAEDMKKAEYMYSQLGARFTGVISSVLYYGFYVQLENTVEGFVSVHDLDHDYYIYDEVRHCLVGQNHHKRYQLGDKIEIRVKNANKDLRIVDFELVEQPTHSVAPSKQHKTRSRAAKAKDRKSNGKGNQRKNRRR
ncbi:MAG: ribonuclease R [Solobacterium sp.]|nr:ribonuclease R [Solobacterium sp.]